MNYNKLNIMIMNFYDIPIWSFPGLGLLINKLKHLFFIIWNIKFLMFHFKDKTSSYKKQQIEINQSLILKIKNWVSFFLNSYYINNRFIDF